MLIDYIIYITSKNQWAYTDPSNVESSGAKVGTSTVHSLSLDYCNQYMWYMGAKMLHGMYLYHVLCMIFGDELHKHSSLFVYRGKCLVCSCSIDLIHRRHHQCQYITTLCIIQSLRNEILRTSVKIEWMDLMLATCLPFTFLDVATQFMWWGVARPTAGRRFISKLRMFKYKSFVFLLIIFYWNGFNKCFSIFYMSCISKSAAELLYLCELNFSL